MARTCLYVATLFAGMVLATVLFGLVKYGSVTASIAAIRNQPLVVDHVTKSFGTIGVGQKIQVEFHLQNVSDRPIQLLGCRTSCDCVTTTEIPTAIEPHGDKLLRFNMTPEQAKRDYVTRIKVFTDVPTQPEAELVLAGRVEG
jgi:hypothetical protein